MSRIAVGLPSNPRARLASSPSPHHLPSRGRQDSHSPSSRSEEPRSLRSVSASRPRQAQVQGTSQDTRRALSRPRLGHNGVRSARTSISSASTSSSGSSSSSYWERGSERSYSTAASEDPPESEEKSDSNIEGSVLGTLLDTTYYWNRATEAASALSQGVSKAWSSGTATQLIGDYEDDSHLLKVMRAYHLSKVQHPSELPDWLFDERERGGKGSFSHAERREVNGDTPMSNAQTEARSRRRQGQVPKPGQTVISGGFLDNKEPASSKGSSESIPRSRPDKVERLKTLRDRRRNIPARF